MTNATPLTRTRTEEERQRRHLHGDTGAKFQAKRLTPTTNPYSSTITTIPKDNLLLTEYD